MLVVVVVVVVHLKGKRIHEAEQLSRSHLDKKQLWNHFESKKKTINEPF